jgi:hypothetical protein
MPRKAVDRPPVAIAPFDPVEKPARLFARKHHADIAGRNPCRPVGVKFVARGKRSALVEGAIRSADAGAEQRRRFGDEDAVQSTGEPPKGHAGLITRGDGGRYSDHGHAATHLCAATIEAMQAAPPISAEALRRKAQPRKCNGGPFA